MTDGDLKGALGFLPHADSRERARLMRLILDELSRRGHFDFNGVRYSVGKDGSLKRSLPWDGPGGPQGDRGGAGR